LNLPHKRLRTAISIVTSLAVAALCLCVWLRPPELIRIESNYTAQIVCSNVFLASRDPEEVLGTDVQAPGNPLLRIMRVAVDRERGGCAQGCSVSSATVWPCSGPTPVVR